MSLRQNYSTLAIPLMRPTGFCGERRKIGSGQANRGLGTDLPGPPVPHNNPCNGLGVQRRSKDGMQVRSDKDKNLHSWLASKAHLLSPALLAQLCFLTKQESRYTATRALGTITGTHRFVAVWMLSTCLPTKQDHPPALVWIDLDDKADIHNHSSFLVKTEPRILFSLVRWTRRLSSVFLRENKQIKRWIRRPQS